MASLFDPADIQKVREAIPIEQLVGQYVTLSSDGISRMKGLCPFHDEKTASFSVTLGTSLWHCFGCGEGGDAIEFVKKIEGLSFREAVEFLAEKAGITLHYVEGAKVAKNNVEPGSRQRLLECNRVAQDFFASQLLTSGAAKAREFVEGRAFTSQDAAAFGIGYAPVEWDSLLRHLRSKGFTDDEIVTAGLAKRGQRGLYDAFRDRVMWPIRNTTGDVLGFGGRRLDDSNKENPKYINTIDSPIYHKSQVLYGIDMARQAISRERRCVIVEGYTDVMAAHLSGITCAVATCGTAFTDEHAKIIRRLIGTNSDRASSLKMPGGAAPRGGEVIFTFDGDEAGQKAALKAFRTDQSFAAQAFVAVAADGLDPCDLRLKQGPRAVVDLINGRKPLFDFVLKTIISQYDLDNRAGCIQAMRAAAPVVAEIRDRALRAEYVVRLGGWLGISQQMVWDAVLNAAKIMAQNQNEPPAERGAASGAGEDPSPVLPPPSRLDPAIYRDPVWRLEKEALVAALQFPSQTAETHFDELTSENFTQPTLRALFEVIAAAGGVGEYARLQSQAAQAGTPEPAKAALNRWAATVKTQAGRMLANPLIELATTPVPVRDEAEVAPWVQEVVQSLERMSLNRQIVKLKAKLNRIDEDDSDRSPLFAQLMELENQLRALESEY